MSYTQWPTLHRLGSFDCHVFLLIRLGTDSINYDYASKFYMPKIKKCKIIHSLNFWVPPFDIWRLKFIPAQDLSNSQTFSHRSQLICWIDFSYFVEWSKKMSATWKKNEWQQTNRTNVPLISSASTNLVTSIWDLIDWLGFGIGCALRCSTSSSQLFPHQ